MSDVKRVNLVFVSDKIINNCDNFKIKFLSYSKISAIVYVIFSVFTLFYLILKNMSTNVKKFLFSSLYVIFDTCDVMYNLSISLLPPIVLDNLQYKHLDLYLVTSAASLKAILSDPAFIEGTF